MMARMSELSSLVLKLKFFVVIVIPSGPHDIMSSLSDFFYNLGIQMILINHNSRRALSEATMKRRYISIFGFEPQVISTTWISIFEGRKTCLPKHLLWALMFVKGYDCEAKLASFIGADEKTVRKYIWLVLQNITERRMDYVSSISSCCLSL
jgi:hypothetical protein